MIFGFQARTADGVAIPAVRRPGRVSGPLMLRIVVLLLALFAVGAYFSNRILQPTSLQAVVNAPMVTLRAPIDGKLVRGGATVGEVFTSGAETFVIRDPRVDLHRQRELQTRQANAVQRVAALDRILGDMELLSTELRERAASYSAAEEARLQDLANGQDIAITNAQTALDFARDQETRARFLVRAGTAVEQRLDEATRTRLIAVATHTRAMADRNGTIIALDAARRQVFMTAGVGGVGYARQRQDEVEIRRLELTYQRSVALGEASSLQHEVDTEVEHVAALREVAVAAAVGGVVSAVYVSAGTDVVRGNPLADVMNCDALYIEATVSTGWFATPRPGDLVRVGLYGVPGTMAGRIRSLRDNAMALDPSRSIPLSERQSRQTVTAIIDIDRKDIALSRGHGCPVGQPASVQFS
ncbi:MAG: hypothetical protein H7251_16195 [Acetobacteraceae bacterium]|nr:hypothetical protein [Acetobacteraceae bacterium]